MRKGISLCILLAIHLSYHSTAQTGTAGNFSVRYNFLFNANELLDEYQRDMIPSPQEDYEKVLPVFISHADKPELMNKVISKARTIILEKGNSKYVGLAHLLMARASFNKADYMTAIAYSDDVLQDYGNDKAITAGAMVVKARALFAIQDLEQGCLLAAQIGAQAANIMDIRVDAYAVAAQGAIYEKNWTKAVQYLDKAIKYSHVPEEKSRMHYVSAQVMEKNHQPLLAAEQYQKAKSTAVFEEMKLNAIIKELALNPSEQQYENGVPLQLTRLLKQKQYQDFRDQLYYTIGTYEQKAGNQEAALSHYLQAASIAGTNSVLKSNAFSRAADLQLRLGKQYDLASENYTQAMKILPKSYSNYSQQRYKLKYGREIAERYLDLAKVDTLKKAVEQAPYNAQIVSAYYDIATMYFQDLQDSLQAAKVYTEINTRFPNSQLSPAVNYALQLLKSGQPGKIGQAYAMQNDFLKKHSQSEFMRATTETAFLNRYRNHGLDPKLRYYDESGSPMEKTEEENTPILAVLKPAAVSLATPFAGLQAANNLIPVHADIRTPATSAPAVKFDRETELGSYYFMIAVEDGGLNMSPSRFGIGEFNRSRYTESNLRHRLLEFENTQVIYVGIFNSLTSARTYASEIGPQLKSIMKTNGAKYSSTIISKENLEKLESDEIYRVYEDFSKP